MTAKEKILIVDDEPFYLECMCEIFESEGYDLLSASGGRQALELVENNQVSLIITDIRMPKGDGVELLLNVRKNRKDFPPIIMMTGFSIHDEQSLLNKGADLILKKPFEVDYLLEKVGEFMAKISPQQAI